MHIDSKDNTPSMLAYIALGTFALVAMYIVVFGVQESSKEIVIGLIAWIAGFVSSAFGFYFGSSHKPTTSTTVEIEKKPE